MREEIGEVDQGQMVTEDRGSHSKKNNIKYYGHMSGRGGLAQWH